MFKRPAALNSIAMRLSAMFALVALLVFVLIGGALYQQVDKSIGRLPEAELDARYSVLESSINRYGNAEHWAKMSANDLTTAIGSAGQEVGGLLVMQLPSTCCGGCGG